MATMQTILRSSGIWKMDCHFPQNPHSLAVPVPLFHCSVVRCSIGSHFLRSGSDFYSKGGESWGTSREKSWRKLGGQKETSEFGSLGVCTDNLHCFTKNSWLSVFTTGILSFFIVFFFIFLELFVYMCKIQVSPTRSLPQSQSFGFSMKGVKHGNGQMERRDSRDRIGREEQVSNSPKHRLSLNQNVHKLSPTSDFSATISGTASWPGSQPQLSATWPSQLQAQTTSMASAGLLSTNDWAITQDHSLKKARPLDRNVRKVYSDILEQLYVEKTTIPTTKPRASSDWIKDSGNLATSPVSKNKFTIRKREKTRNGQKG